MATVRQYIAGLKSDHVKIPALLERIIEDVEKAGFPPDMEVNEKMASGHADIGTFHGAIHHALLACS